MLGSEWNVPHEFFVHYIANPAPFKLWQTTRRPDSTIQADLRELVERGRALDVAFKHILGPVTKLMNPKTRKRKRAYLKISLTLLRY